MMSLFSSVGKFFSTICYLMQKALDCLQNWCGEIGLNVNADKTFMVFFTKERNFEGFFTQDSLTRK
jgi:hypothetical protein